MELLSFSLVYLVPVSVLLGYWLGGIYTFMTPVFIFGVVPLLDMIIGKDTKNPDAQEASVLEQAGGYRVLTWLCAPFQVIMVLWGAHVVSNGSLNTLEMMGFILSMGVSSGVMGINVAHELAHRVNTKMEPVLSKIMLWTTLYMHWGLEHVVGHHRWVATPEDPATARLGESFYKFWPRTVSEGFNKAWEFEAGRMKKLGVNVWSLKNPMARAIFVQSALIVGMAAVFGLRGVVYFLAQSVIAFSLLEVVNYIEHYGLLRSKKDDGTYEPVTPLHSWNSSNWLTNRFLFNLQRHSDHHYKPGNRYQLLRHSDQSPQLPTGYAGMILLAVLPPLWRKYMDPRVLAFKEKSAYQH
jgi:alkane 1-monooxygenase